MIPARGFRSQTAAARCHHKRELVYCHRGITAGYMLHVDTLPVTPYTLGCFTLLLLQQLTAATVPRSLINSVYSLRPTGHLQSVGRSSSPAVLYAASSTVCVLSVC